MKRLINLKTYKHERGIQDKDVNCKQSNLAPSRSAIYNGYLVRLSVDSVYMANLALVVNLATFGVGTINIAYLKHLE